MREALNVVCEHRVEIQELFDLKFAKLEFMYLKYKDEDTKARLEKFKKLYKDLDKLLNLCDEQDTNS